MPVRWDRARHRPIEVLWTTNKNTDASMYSILVSDKLHKSIFPTFIGHPPSSVDRGSRQKYQTQYVPFNPEIESDPFHMQASQKYSLTVSSSPCSCLFSSKRDSRLVLARWTFLFGDIAIGRALLKR